MKCVHNKKRIVSGSEEQEIEENVSDEKLNKNQNSLL